MGIPKTVGGQSLLPERGRYYEYLGSISLRNTYMQYHTDNA